MKIAGLNPFRPGRRLSEGPAPVTGTAYAGTPPDSCDVVVLGGGITGLVAGIELAKRGQKVVVLEKGRIGAEQTSRALGWVASLGDEGLRLPLSLRSKDLWQGYQNDHGIETSYRRCGLTFLCHSTKEMDALAAWRDRAAKVGSVDAHALSLEEVKRLMPPLNMPTLVGAWHQPSDGKVTSEQVAPALARIATALGVRIIENCAARSLDQSAGTLSGVETERGLIRTGAALVAGGAWSRTFLRQHGVQISQLSVYSSLYRTGPVSSTLGPIGLTGSLGWTRASDGGVTFGNNSGIASITPESLRLLRQFLPALRADHSSLTISLDSDFLRALGEDLSPTAKRQALYETHRIVGAQPDEKTGKTVLAALQRELPDFSKATIRHSWAGVIDVTPDKAPIIGQMGCAGLYVCTGFSAHGLAMAPAAAEIAADLIVGNTPTIPASPYSNARFTAPRT